LGGFASYLGDPFLAPAMAFSFGLLGPWVARRGVRVIGWRMTLVGLAAGVSWVAQAWSRFTVAAWVSQWSWLLPVLLVPLVLVRFPHGLVTGRWRLLEAALVALAFIPTSLLAVAALGAPRNLLTGGEPTRPEWTDALVTAAIAGSGLWLVPCSLTGVLLVARARGAAGQERAQIACLGLGLIALMVGIGLLIAGAPAAVEAFAAVSVPVAVAAAVLNYALYDLDLVVNRLMVWLALTAVVTAGFVALVTLLSFAVPGDPVQGPELLALLILALTVEPLRRRLQTGVDRMLFGRRAAPAEAFAVVSRDLGRAATAGSSEVLCHAIAATLKLPWVAIRGEGGVTASWGRRIDDVRSFPLTLGERRVGELLVCPRRVNQRLTRDELAIIDGMAAQVAVAVEAMSLAETLRDARQRIVASREQERVRLRNDLHDGLGPALVGLRLQAAAGARHSVEPAVSAAFDQISQDATQCVEEVSRVLEGLRPAALDQGLQAAIEGEARRLARGDLAIDVVVPQPLPAISEAAEVAAFRIACEAMSNAVRHAHAKSVRVQLTAGATGTSELLLRVADDGRGLGPAREGGVGLQSIRHRADEVGGFVSITPGPGSGTVVTAELPLAGP
jgi:signal transduction histidine kinase